MNLHYSQTKDIKAGLGDMVLLPYEFTLLSNGELEKPHWHFVLLPYEFTLLSNLK